MNRQSVGLVLLNGVSSALCWLPTIIVPSLDFPAWVPFAPVALSAGLSSILNRKYWSLFVFGSAIGTFGGLCLGYLFWWPTTPYADHWFPLLSALLPLSQLLYR